MTQRYKFVNDYGFCGCSEVEDDEGEYVRYEEYQKLLTELEREQMRLAACGVVAMANTPDTAAKARDILPEYRSASCDDVARMVDENMKLRAAIDRVRALHAPIEIASKKFCDECNNETEYWVVPHPCPTLRAIDGEDA